MSDATKGLTYKIPALKDDANTLFGLARTDTKATVDTRYDATKEAPMKLLDTAKKARDNATKTNPGSGWRIGGVTRADNAKAFRGYLDTWTPQNAGAVSTVAAWVTSQFGASGSDQAKQYLWWLKAKDASKESKAWNTAMAAKVGAGKDLT